MTLKSGKWGGQIFQADLAFWPRRTKFCITLAGKGIFLAVSQAPVARGRGPSAPNFGDDLIWCNTWEGAYFRGSATPCPKGAEPRHSPILGFYLCPHPLMQNDQIRCGNTANWGWAYFRGEPHHCPLHMCCAVCQRYQSFCFLTFLQLAYRTFCRFPSSHIFFSGFLASDYCRTLNFGCP